MSTITTGFIRRELKFDFIKRLFQLFIDPGRIFSLLRERPDFIWPVFFLLLNSAFSSVFNEYSQKLIRDIFPKYAEMFAKNTSPGWITATINGLFQGILVWFLATGVYYMLAEMFGGDTVRFWPVLSMIGYCNIAGALQAIYQGTVFLITGILPPLGFESGMELAERFFSPQGILLSVINPFTLFGIFLVVIALDNAFSLSRAKSIVIALIYWIFSTGFLIGSSMLTFSFLR